MTPSQYNTMQAITGKLDSLRSNIAVLQDTATNEAWNRLISALSALVSAHTPVNTSDATRMSQQATQAMRDIQLRRIS